MNSMPVRIRRARTSASMTQADIARRLGVSRSAVTQWERSNGTAPSVEHLLQLACETGVCFEWLATGRGNWRPVESALDTAALLIQDFASDEQESRALNGMKRLNGRKKEVAASIIELLAQM